MFSHKTFCGLKTTDTQQYAQTAFSEREGTLSKSGEKKAFFGCPPGFCLSLVLTRVGDVCAYVYVCALDLVRVCVMDL